MPGYQPPYYPRQTKQKPSGRRNFGSLPKNQKKALPKKPKNTKRTDASQNRAIMTLSKQIKELQMSQYGRRQKNYQQSQASYVPLEDRPLLFDVTDFTCASANNPGYQGAQIFQNNAAGALTQQDLWTSDTLNNNPFWDGQNEDVVDTGMYFPEYVKLNIRIRGRPNLSDTRIRIDFMQQKVGTRPDILAGTSPDLRLPQSLQFFNFLATPNDNKINTSYFKIYKTKWIYLNSSKTNANVKGTTGNTAYLDFTFRPKKPRVQNVTTPVAGIDAQAVADEFQYGDFGPDQVAIDQPLWCLISTSDSNDPGSIGSVVVNMSRTCIWRDTIGSSKVAT